MKLGLLLTMLTVLVASVALQAPDNSSLLRIATTLTHITQTLTLWRFLSITRKEIPEQHKTPLFWQ